MMQLCKLKALAIMSILSITLAVIIAMAFLAGFGAMEAGIDIAVVTLGVNGIVSVLKSPNQGTDNDNN